MSHSSLTPVFHTEWQYTKLLARFSQAHPHTDKKSFREYWKCTDYFETRYIKCGVSWEQLHVIHSGCWLNSAGSFSNKHSTSWSWNFCLAFFSSLMNILKCLLPAVLLLRIIAPTISSQFGKCLTQDKHALCNSDKNSEWTQICPVQV